MLGRHYLHTKGMPPCNQDFARTAASRSPLTPPFAPTAEPKLRRPRQIRWSRLFPCHQRRDSMQPFAPAHRLLATFRLLLVGIQLFKRLRPLATPMPRNMLRHRPVRLANMGALRPLPVCKISSRPRPSTPLAHRHQRRRAAWHPGRSPRRVVGAATFFWCW